MHLLAHSCRHHSADLGRRVPAPRHDKTLRYAFVLPLQRHESLRGALGRRLRRIRAGVRADL